MNGEVQIGNPSWTRDEIISSLDEFLELYARRPIQDNQGGMHSPHMFAVWFMVKKLKPDLIVESGIWRGQGTWLLEQASSESKIVSIDLDLSRREYISKTVTYSDQDFSNHDWSAITDRSLAFFDDHQNAYTRLQQCKWFGFRNIIFEDNYPLHRGDCYSLKKAFAQAAFAPEAARGKGEKESLTFRIMGRLGGIVNIHSSVLTNLRSSDNVEADHDINLSMLQKNLEIYYEFPPVFISERTRWGDAWDDIHYPTAEPLLRQVTKPIYKIFLDEAKSYTWICYVRLR